MFVVDGLDLSYAVTLAFEGAGEATIPQVKVGGWNIDRQDDAIESDGYGNPPYLMAKDSWAYQPFQDGGLAGISPLDDSQFSGFRRATNAYQMSLGTGPNSEYGDATNVAYIVADGDVTWTGTICRDAEYDVGGSTGE